MQPLQAAGHDGIELLSGDGAVRLCFPIFAVYIADYPEQVMVTIIKTGLCPSCPAPCEGIGEPPSYLHPHEVTPIKTILETISQGPTAFMQSCAEAGLKLIAHPFWKNLPFVNIYSSITPDILHQLFQGLRLVCAVRALLDFVQLARYPVHSDETLELLNAALVTFHDNKDIFVDLDIHNQWNIIKLHYAQHYRFFIELFGTTDNTDTQYTEQLHIDLAKEAYNSTNKKDEFAQMTLWLECKECVCQHDKFLQRQFICLPTLQAFRPSLMPSLVPLHTLKMAKDPSCHAVSFSTLHDEYGALDFQNALACMIVQFQHPELKWPQEIWNAVQCLPMLCQSVSVYHRIKFVSHDPFTLDKSGDTQEYVVDSIHAQPARVGKYDVGIPAQFDTALVDFNDGHIHGIKGYTVAQIHCIFSLPSHAQEIWFRGNSPSKHFAYDKWFTPFSVAGINPASNLYKVSHLQTMGEQISSVIAIDIIKGSVHLFPSFGPKAPESWVSSNVLTDCKKFYVSLFNDRYQYSVII
ncbi:hypothetical protein BDQ17DRAFT_1435129 [Cyathus striatus]|nr:hypothetical protein BDQ17DRAFT_1435129 [Cyathus striatus]